MLTDYSDPREVTRRGLKLGLKVEPSTRKDKKYMVFDGKPIHFGQMGYEDFTKHKDEKRRTSFQKRNHKWAAAPRNTPAWLSYHLLW